MGNLVPIEQSSYNQGMILGVRQDASFERNELQSAYWIENLTPNTVIGELVTRPAQEQDTIDGTLVETSTTGQPISALEMTHGASTTKDKSALHIFHEGQPSIRTSNEGRTSFNNGVWSNGQPFNYPVADYDVYGESVLLVSDKANVLDEPKRRPVYAYTYKDYGQYFGQKNEANKDLLLYGVPKPVITTKRWEVLDEQDLEKIVNVVWGTEDVPNTEEAKYLTAEAPLINGKIMNIAGAQIADNGNNRIDDVTPVKTTYSIKSGSRSASITAYGWSYDDIVTPPTPIPGMGLSYDPLDNVLQQLVPILNNFINRTKYNSSFDPATVYSPEPSYRPLAFPIKFPILWKVIDYVDANKPRNFYVGERIPYIVTAVVNGIEKVIKKDIFTVHNNNTINVGVVSQYNIHDVTYTDPDPQVGVTTYQEALHTDFIAQTNASKRVNFNIELTTRPELLPIGLSEIRLYIANKNIGERGMWNYVFPNLPSLNEVTSKDGYSGWVTLPDSLYLNPDSDREAFSYSLAKSFVVFGDPDLYARRNVNTDHSNWGVNNVKVNEWEDTGTKLVFVNKDGSTVRSEFYVWDYMDRVGEPLATNLGTGLLLWKGRGASVIASMKGVTFIAGCLDTAAKVEAGLIRKSLLQGAVQSTDTFAETDFIKVGNETHTALIEFRGQLWAFSKTQMHRIQMRDMADLDTVEVLEVLENNGTFSPKTVIATPFGVAWCNESGVWLSNGGEPTLLSKEVEPLYQSMVRGTLWIGQQGDRIDWNIGTDLYNKWMQIAYDSLRYDLVVSSFAIRLPNAISPEGDDIYLDFRLIYNIVYKNWRVETYRINTISTETSFNKIHRTHWTFGKYKSLGWRGTNVKVNTSSLSQVQDFGVQLIENRLTLHEIGNGIDDCQANSVATEAAYLLPDPVTLPKLTIVTGETLNVFQFPGTQNVTDILPEGELVSRHIANNTAPYWVQNSIDTPIETPAQGLAILNKSIPLKATYNMTSQLHRVPFMKPVRRFMVEYIVRGNVRLRSLRLLLRSFTRKFWG